MAQKRIFVNGQELFVDTDSNGRVSAQQLHEAADIDVKDRQLVRLKPDGNYIINPSEEIYIDPGEHFGDMPKNTRG